jgi:hypothetical protein
MRTAEEVARMLVELEHEIDISMDDEEPASNRGSLYQKKFALEWVLGEEETV